MADDGHQASLRIRVLGPVRAWRGDTELDLGSARRKAVFAVLALQAGHAVSKARLVAGVWGDDLPATVEGSLHTYVSGLRRVLEPGRSRWSGGEVLVSAGDGYALHVRPECLDVHRFERLRTEGAYGEALALWHGTALDGVSGPYAQAQRDRLGELRMLTVEQHAQELLARGRAEEVVADLVPLAAEHPRRETLHGLLMLALRQSGRPEEALAVYAAINARLGDELGIEPGAALRQIRDQVSDRMSDIPAVVTARKPAGPDVVAGRHHEISDLRRYVRALAAGRGGTVWLEGEPGIGKTTTVSAALAEAPVPVLWGAGDELNRRFAMRTMLECLGVDAQAADPRRAAVAASLREDSSPTLITERLLALVEQLCADGPLALVVDDLHWADPASLLLWRRLAVATRRLPLLLVGVSRPAPAHDDFAHVRSAVLAAGADLIRLDPLDEDAVADLAHAWFGAEPGASLLELAERAAGNPLYLHDVFTALRRHGLVEIDDGIAEVPEGAADQLPRNLATAVTRRLGFLGEPAREVLRWAALLGTEFDLADLAAVLGKAVSELLGGVEEALAAAVLCEAGERFAFRHALVRQALYEAMPTAVRLSLHRQAAETLDRAGAAPHRVAEQLLAAPVPVDAWVARWLIANGNAVADRDPDAAVRLLERAVTEPAVPRDAREDLTARLARTRFWLGGRPEPEARAVLEMTADPGRAAEMRLILAYLDYHRGDVTGALAALREAVADPTMPERWRARHQSLQAMIERLGLDDLPLAEATATDALAKARAADDPWAAAHALQDLWQIESVQRAHEAALVHVDGALEAVRGEPDLGDLQLSLLDNKVFTLQNLDRLDEATATLTMAQDLISRRGLDGGMHIPAAVHWYWLGRWDDAMTELDAVVRDSPEITFYGLRQRGAILLLHGVSALIAGLRGDGAQLAAHLRDAEEYPLASVEDREHCDFLLAAAAIAAEQHDRPDEALRVLAPTLNPKYARMMLRHQWLPVVVRLALTVGDRETARQALEVCESERAMEAVPARAANATDWCRGLVDGDGELVLAVAGRFGTAGRRVEQALALEDAAVLLARGGSGERARATFATCVARYSELGASWCVRRAESRLLPFGIDRTQAVAGARLSPVQLRIAELVADGWPTTDIAAQLMLSRSSVETHVARLVDRLKVSSRLGITREAIERNL
ncbi:BTAD domain-containing putative transcriptional regulator [Labedaea rhizosphaerae]|uniref:Transcriptional regulator n=1 Tax=Labedaea rhizosphaerae TaxID=598644 RepID=A0A4R6SDP3_LABRH|nr:BTAD domain-containing putative transcriptional regulator [Labedaea rhizosphaerae]TDP97753.1 transcriptional regulator [Labedaea rhizosphaerae]